jgi:hypothetical protein
MAHVAKHSRPAGTPFALERPAADAVGPEPVPAVSGTDAGIAMLAAEDARRPVGPVTTATWAATVRRFARRLVWVLPLSAVVSGAATMGAVTAGGPTALLGAEQPLRLIAWFGGVWLGLVALLALVGLLAAARTRVTAVAGLLTALLGAVPMLTFAALPPDTPVYATDARVVAYAAGAVYGLGWMLVGLALIRSRLFSRGDGMLLVLAGPLLGVGGLWLAPLHTFGALLTLAAGIGIAWTSGRLLPTVGRTAAPSASRRRGRRPRTASAHPATPAPSAASPAPALP